jgi:hypothetical protein
VGRGRDPEPRVADSKLRDDVVALTYTMQDSRAERVAVKLQRSISVLDPQFRLDARHG